VISALKPAATFRGAVLHAHNATSSDLAANVSGQRARLDEEPVAADVLLHRNQIAAWRLEYS
jgi:hypothetical protein